MSVVIWSDGALREPTDLLVSGIDHGLTVGDGVFETCAVYDGQAFALSRHLRRLRRSAQGLGLGEPDEAEVRTAVTAVLDAAGPDVGRLRITLTGHDTWCAAAGGRRRSVLSTLARRGIANPTCPTWRIGSGRHGSARSGCRTSSPAVR